MLKLKKVSATQLYRIKSAIELTPRQNEALNHLLNNPNHSYGNGTNCKQMICSSNWLMLRMSKAIRILIHTRSLPKEVWVIPRRELTNACKTIKLRNLA